MSWKCKLLGCHKWGPMVDVEGQWQSTCKRCSEVRRRNGPPGARPEPPPRKSCLQPTRVMHELDLDENSPEEGYLLYRGYRVKLEYSDEDDEIYASWKMEDGKTSCCVGGPTFLILGNRFKDMIDDVLDTPIHEWAKGDAE